MDDLIVVKDYIAVPRQHICRAGWREEKGEKILQVVFLPVIEGIIQLRELQDDLACEFWEKFTGQRVSWDERPVEE